MHFLIRNNLYEELAKVNLPEKTSVPQLIEVIFREINRQESENDRSTTT